MSRIHVSNVMSLIGTLVDRPDSIPLLERVRSAIIAYAEIADRGPHLIDIEDLDERMVAEIIALTTGASVSSLTFLSVSRPMRPRRWRLAPIPSGDFPGLHQARQNWIGRGIARNGFLFSHIVDRWNDDLWLELGDTADALADILNREVIGPLADALIWNTDVDRLGETVAGLYRVPLFYAAGFALLGERDHCEHLLPMLDLLSKVIVVGERRGMSGSWVVLIA